MLKSSLVRLLVTVENFLPKHCQHLLLWQILEAGLYAVLEEWALTEFMSKRKREKKSHGRICATLVAWSTDDFPSMSYQMNDKLKMKRLR